MRIFLLFKCFFLFNFLGLNQILLAQGTETFQNIPAATSSYTVRNWTGDNGLPWSASDARTDQSMNGRAILIRNGAITVINIPNGITSLSFKHQLFFTGANPVLQVYINNVLIGTANPATTVATATFNNINVSGNFNLEIRQVTPGLRIGIDDVAWSQFNVAVCNEPAAAPTGLALNPSLTSISGNFIPNASSTDEYLVLRSTSSSLTATPADGTVYSIGQAIGNGVVIGAGNINSFNDVSLLSNTSYNYFIFSYNNYNCTGGPNYLITSLNGTATTPSPPPCIIPAASASNLVLTPATTSISGTFTASGANRFLTVKSISSNNTFVPVNGITYSSGQTFEYSSIVSFSASTSFTATGLDPYTNYYFYIFFVNVDCSGQPFYSSNTLTGSQSTLATGIPPAYYSSVTNQTCGELKTVLYNIIKPTSPNPAPDYGGICFIYPTTDLKRSDDGLRNIIWDMYSDNPSGVDPYEFEYGVDVDGCGGSPNNPPIPGTSEGLMYNREHSFPQSWFGGAVEPMNSDIMHVFPTDREVNNKRASHPYGSVSTTTYTSLNGSKLGTNNTGGFSGTVFEPINEYKGDFARVQFYMITAYENLVAGWESNKPEIFNGTSYPAFDNWYINLLFQWHLNDPVSVKEINRNNAVYILQGNRNPYVDHPEYLSSILTCSGVVLVPVTLTSFTAALRNNDGLLQWTATNETNFKTYEVERGINGVDFQKIGEVTGRNLANYNFIDANIPHKNVVFYRLKMIDIDGKFSYSTVVALKLNNNFSNAFVYPNPTKEKLNIRLYEPLSTKSTIYITDVTGRLVKQQTASQGSLDIALDVQRLPAGRYIIRISNSEQVINLSFIVVK